MATWYYAENDQQKGPVEPDEIERLIEIGTVGENTLVWKAGLAEWEAAHVHFTFANAAPPPLQAPQATQQASPVYGGPQHNDPNIGPDGLYVGAPSREFVEAIKVCLNKYVTFSGRASRSEFWFFYLFFALAVTAAQFADFALIFAAIASGIPFFIPILTLITILGLFLPQMAVSWRRLHDADRSGWWIGGGILAGIVFYGIMIAVIFGTVTSTEFNAEPPIAFIAFSGIFGLAGFAYAITLLVFYVSRGTLGPNRFG